MDHYIDIQLLPDPEFPVNILMNALFAKLHRGLVEGGCDKIGISFPKHDNAIPTLGSHLRLHGIETDLAHLMATSWLKGMRDHVYINGPLLIPEPNGYRCVHRVQAKSSPERLRRRLMKRHNLSEESAIDAIPDSVMERLKLPYATLNSQSTGQHFRLFIEHAPIVKHVVSGSFNQYGLSTAATIPWF